MRELRAKESVPLNVATHKAGQLNALLLLMFESNVDLDITDEKELIGLALDLAGPVAVHLLEREAVQK
ncbi:hypothetical protein VYJ29_003200 [Yersinia enterocolitica]|uniref:hypothetical protein n=1 Tax=Hafnia paralvei TaxID=546367 RepID=UPI001F1914E0|nr:hypothetical protein [Hafnia paralvei]ELI7915043.1 hypothetical protein [Yersinia enterocolitica]ELI7927277.1 hypothetical protein [Yersinia enterocolitica]ELI7959628.1 hypothetical protein [Yersinia enterocolitica]ELI8139812.1 hypothetical protein [Yersinia enterocolitica]ELI8180487.1 hypothetical protein [Yersinia enterocolitica]